MEYAPMLNQRLTEYLKSKSYSTALLYPRLSSETAEAEGPRLLSKARKTKIIIIYTVLTFTDFNLFSSPLSLSFSLFSFSYILCRC